MKTLLSVVFVLIFVLSVSSQSAPPHIVRGELDSATGWRKISSSSDRFTALMPSSAELSEETLSSDSSSKLRKYQSVGNLVATIVGVIDMTGVLNDPKIPKTTAAMNAMRELMLESAEVEMRRSMSGGFDLEARGEVVMGSAKGRQYGVIKDGQYIGRMNLVLNGDYAYILIAMSMNGERSPEVSRFFNSVVLN